MNLGLFAKGLDLMPDFGYPPVQFGGWDSTHSRWYTRTLAHNTVVVDRANTSEGAGRTTMWADGEQFRAIRVDGPEMNGGRRYERTVAMVDVSSEEAYLVDVFRVAGGREHLKLMHSHFGQVTSAGLSLEEDRALDLGEQMRNVRIDPAPEPGWHVDWAVEDRYEILDPGASVHLRYTDLTRGTQAGLAEAWVVAGGYSSTEEAWIPRVLIRREAAGDEPLASTFVAIVEPHEKTPAIADIRRVEVRGVNGEALPDTHAGIVVSLADGRRDIFIARDPMDAAVSEVAISTEPTLQTDAELCMVRLMPDGRLAHAALCHGSFVRIGDEEVRLGSTRDFAELSSEGPAP